MTKQEIIKSTSGTIQCEFIIDGVRVVPTSATVTIVSPTGLDLTTPVTDAACTISTYGIVSYTLAAGNTGTAAEGYMATFTAVIDTVNNYQRVIFDIVVSSLRPILTFEDLLKENPMLAKEAFQTRGTVTATIDTGYSKTKFIDTEVNTGEELPSQYVGWVIEMLTGSNAGWWSLVTAYSAGTFTLKKTAVYNFTIGDEYRLQNRYANEIERAWEKLIERLRAKGRKASLIMDSTELKEAHMLCTLSMIMLGMGRMEHYQIYQAQYNLTVENLRLTYDDERLGAVSTANQSVLSSVRLRR
jgi:hypothetical protein